MKKFKLFLLFIFIALIASSQTLIATSYSEYATINHNQRKIVRDTTGNIFVVFSDYSHPSYIIKGVKFEAQTGLWGEAFTISEGFNPSIAISDGPDYDFHLVYNTLDSIRHIEYRYSNDFQNWEQEVMLSDENQYSERPIADIDSIGMLNIFWRQFNPDTTYSLIYAKVSDGTLVDRKWICTKDVIYDYAIANHLQYVTNDLVFGIEYSPDSVAFFHSNDGMITYDTLYSTIGSQPGITCNTNHIYEEGCSVRLLYVDIDSYLMEVEFNLADKFTPKAGQLPVGQVDYYCVDDLAPPIGYSFLFMQYGMLYHAFSYGPVMNWCSIMETVSGEDYIQFPSIAYKHFSFEYVDFIWMEGYAQEREIYYMRDEKHIWTGLDEDTEVGKGFSITAGPNPFSDHIDINIITDNENETPLIQIYNTSSILVRQFSFNAVNPDGYSLNWDGKSETGEKLTAGVYIIVCSVGNKRTARKIVFQP